MRFVIEMKFKRRNVTQDRKRKAAHKSAVEAQSAGQSPGILGSATPGNEASLVVSHVYVEYSREHFSVSLSLSLEFQAVCLKDSEDSQRPNVGVQVVRKAYVLIFI